MQIGQQSLGHCYLITLHGRMNQQITADLEQLLRTLIEEGQSRLVVDLADVHYINSSGLRTLLSGWRQARAAGGDLLLCALSSRLQALFAMVGFDNVFKIHPTRASATAVWEQ